MAEKLIHIFKAFLDIFFPQKCVGCGTRNTIFCDKCLNSLPFPENEFRDSKSVFKGRILAATSYKNDVVKKAIRLLKYRGIKILAEPLAELIFLRLFKDRPCAKCKLCKASPCAKTNLCATCTIIVPIPLTNKRLRQRGYNQAELLAKCLSDKLSVKIGADVLCKIKETISQVEIKDRDKRLKNIQGVFKIKNPEIIKNKNIILIDDITTTGATLKEASIVLKQAGAKNVIGLVVAKG